MLIRKSEGLGRIQSKSPDAFKKKKKKTLTYSLLPKLCIVFIHLKQKINGHIFHTVFIIYEDAIELNDRIVCR